MGSQVGGFMTQDFVNDCLWLIEEPHRQRNPVLGKVGVSDCTGHPSTEANLNRSRQVIKPPDRQTPFKMPSQHLGTFRRDVSLPV